MALVGVERETLVSEPDAPTTRTLYKICLINCVFSSSYHNVIWTLTSNFDVQTVMCFDFHSNVFVFVVYC